MASAVAGNVSMESRSGPVQPVGDELDDLFNYDADMGGLFRDVDTNMDAPAPPNQSAIGEARNREDVGSGGLGIDEEITVTKKKRVVVKLDENRLLSQAGIPKMRRTAKTGLRFKGKGHEYTDAARLLAHYQLWLDALYPKARFADGLSIIEKLGHSRRMQTMRREWIDEGKPRLAPEDLDDDALDATDLPVPSSAPSELPGGEATMHRPSTPIPSGRDDEDLYSGTPTVVRPRHDDTDPSEEAHEGEDEDLAPDDELDVLLAEDAARGLDNERQVLGDTAKEVTISQGQNEDGFEDDMEAMAELDGMW
ncbi:MAG: chromosome segregation in meiosis- protein [Caeruleum heppii]|nr:MAG: chromosome segregation in meiosis- protein [Caeruleum heppii]